MGPPISEDEMVAGGIGGVTEIASLALKASIPAALFCAIMGNWWLVGAAIAVAVVTTIITYRPISETDSSSSSSAHGVAPASDDRRTKVAVSFIRLGILVGREGGGPSISQLAAIRGFFENRRAPGWFLSWVNRTITLESGPQDRAREAATIVRYATIEEKLTLLSGLASVAYAAGEPRAGELTFLRHLGRELRLPYPDVERAIRKSPSAQENQEQSSRREGQPALSHDDDVLQAFKVLGLAPTDDLARVKAAFRKKATQYHPDKVAHLAPEFAELAEERTRALNAAYATIRALLRSP